VFKHKQIERFFGIWEDVLVVSLDDFIYVKKNFKSTGWKIIHFA